MPRVLITTLLLLLSVFSTARADYVFHTFNGVIRYSNNGKRLIEYGGGTGGPGERPHYGRGYWLGESVDAIAASPDGHLFASTNNLGSRSLLHFDTDSGLNLSGPSEGEYGSEPEVWRSDWRYPEEECGSDGCSYYNGLFATARLRDGLLFHPDGHLYAIGIADLWETQGLNLGPYVRSEAALIRFPLDLQGAPTVVSVLPVPVLGGEYGGGEDFFGKIVLGPNNQILIDVQPEYRYEKSPLLSVDPSRFNTTSFPFPFTVQANIVSPDTGHITGRIVDADGTRYYQKSGIIWRQLPSEEESTPFITEAFEVPALSHYVFGSPFLDDQGHLLLPRTRFVCIEEDDYYGCLDSRQYGGLLEFDLTTGEFLRLVFEEELGEIEYYFGSGFYLPVPEPSCLWLGLISIGLMLNRRSRPCANLALR